MLTLSSRLADRRLALRLPRPVPNGSLVITVRDRKTMLYLGPSGWTRSQTQLPGELIEDGTEFLVTAVASETLNTTRHLQFEIPALVLTLVTNWALPAPPPPPPTPPPAAPAPPRLRPVDALRPLAPPPDGPSSRARVGRRTLAMLGLAALLIAILPAAVVATITLRATGALQDELDAARVTVADLQATASKSAASFEKQLADKDALLSQARKTASEASTRTQEQSRKTAELNAKATELDSLRQKLDQRAAELDAREKAARDRESTLTRREAEVAQRAAQPSSPVAVPGPPVPAVPPAVVPPPAAGAVPPFASVYKSQNGRYYAGRGDTKAQADDRAFDACFTGSGSACSETASLGGAGPKCFAMAVGSSGQRFVGEGANLAEAGRRSISACESATRLACKADQDLALCAR